MSIYKHGVTWRAEAWVDNQRIGVQPGFSSKADAKEWRDLQRVNFLSGKQAPKEETLTFENLLDRFQTMHLPTVSPGTKRRYTIEIEQRIKPTFRFRKLDEISAMAIEVYRSEILKTLTPKSVNLSMGLLGTIFRKGVEWGLMDKSPNRIRPLKLPDRKYRWWDKGEDIQKFLKVAKLTPHYAAYRIALECGLRLGELIGLTRQDIDLERCQIHVHRQWLDKQFCYGPPKMNGHLYDE